MTKAEVLELPHYYEAVPDAADAYLVLNGVSGHFTSEFIQGIIQRLSGRSASILAYDYPFQANNGEKPSPDLVSEVASLQSALTFLHETEGYQNLRVIAKSLGGIILNCWLTTKGEGKPPISAAILGYVAKDMNTPAFDGTLRLVIQGQDDRYGSPVEVMRLFEDFQQPPRVIGVSGDHSYRNVMELGQPDFQNNALETLLANLSRL